MSRGAAAKWCPAVEETPSQLTGSANGAGCKDVWAPLRGLVGREVGIEDEQVAGGAQADGAAAGRLVLRGGAGGGARAVGGGGAARAGSLALAQLHPKMFTW